MQDCGAALAIADQVRTVAAIVQPPGQNRRAIGAPQRQPGLTQAAVGADGVEIDQQAVFFISVLADDLLRILAQFGQRRALCRLTITGQAQHQGLQGTAQSCVTLLRLLAGDRLADLIQIAHRRRLAGQAEQWQAED
ncbi:hypothetical protein D3C80_1792760 [compost metagenome]